jgi:uncharacterized protein YbaR (Trm112 family)
MSDATTACMACSREVGADGKPGAKLYMPPWDIRAGRVRLVMCAECRTDWDRWGQMGLDYMNPPPIREESDFLETLLACPACKGGGPAGLTWASYYAIVRGDTDRVSRRCPECRGTGLYFEKYNEGES